MTGAIYGVGYYGTTDLTPGVLCYLLFFIHGFNVLYYVACIYFVLGVSILHINSRVNIIFVPSLTGTFYI